MDDDSSSIVTPQDKKGGGKKKSNGHKMDCVCPICKNMMGKNNKEDSGSMVSKKSNGHKGACKCPICINMKHKKASSKNRRVKRNSTKKGMDEEMEGGEEELDMDGGQEVDDGDKFIIGGGKKRKGNGHKPTCKCPICKNMRKGKTGGSPNTDMTGDETLVNKTGGSRRRRRGKSNKKRRTKRRR
jgi:hypothetical protein